MTSLKLLHAEPSGHASIIEALEDALEQARRGELSSIGIAKVDRAGCIPGSWSRAPSIALLIAATTGLQHRLLRALNGDEDP